MRLEELRIAAYGRLPRPVQVRAVRWGTPNFTVGTVALLTRTGADLLWGRPSYRRGGGPRGGLVGRGETPTAGLARELAEELGVQVQLAPAHRVALEPRRQMVTFVCAGRLPADAEPVPCSPEVLEVRWFPLDRLPPLPADFHEGVLPEDLEAVRRAGASSPEGVAGPGPAEPEQTRDPNR